MSLPIKTLPIVERWDCTACGLCCYGNQVALNDDDLQKLKEQKWESHPDFKKIKTVVRQGLINGRKVLAQREDGGCVFLDADGLCRIHKEHGYDAKPLICRMYPLQLVPLEKSAQLTMRRSCPTAAAEVGKELGDHREQAKRFAKERPDIARSSQPPAIVRGRAPSWPETMLVGNGIQRLLTDERYPLVRRIVHGLLFCNLLEKAKLKRLSDDKVREAITLFAEAAEGEVGDLFRTREEPGRAAGALFRQTLLEYLRLHPSYSGKESWSERWRLGMMSLKFARGVGPIPSVHESFPPATFEEVDQPLGHLEPEIQKPLLDYYQANATSLQYAIVSRRGWSLIEKYRALALAYPVMLWMMRFFKQQQTPNLEQTIELVTTIDRGQGYGPLTGRQHRGRIKTLYDLASLEKLVLWYAR